MLKNFSIILLAIIYVSLASCQQKENNLNFVSINTDSCAKWNLPDLNLTLYIPKEYQLTYNSSGGFYFQAHKFNDTHKIVSEISFGRIEGNFNPSNSIDMLYEADSIIREQFEEINQKYNTLFIGIDTIYDDIKLPQLRNCLQFDKFNTVLDGTYYGYTSPVFLDEKNRLMISAMFNESERFSGNRMISEDLIKIIKSIRPIIKN